MKVTNQIESLFIRFSKWTRKSYAAFRSIGKTVNIDFLMFDLYTTFYQTLFRIIDIQNIKVPSIINHDLFVNQQFENKVSAHDYTHAKL